MNAGKVKVPLSKAYRLINHGPCVLVTTCDPKGRPNVMTLAWSMVINYEPALVAIGVGRSAHSHGNIKRTGQFVINIPDTALTRALVYCGSSSGRKKDKFRGAHLTPEKASRVDPPLIRECIAHIECRLEASHRYADVTVFVGRVVAASVKKGLFRNCFIPGKARTVHHMGEGVFAVTGRRVGTRS